MDRKKQPSRTDPASLARLLELDENDWSATARDRSTPDPEPELAAMLAHQLAAPITADLKLSDNQIAEAKQFGTFANLLDHPSPAVWLLEETKQLAKRNRAHGDSGVRQISTVLYYSAIAAAVLKCRSRITELTDAQLKEGFDWATKQRWVDEKTRFRIESAADTLKDKW